MYMYLTINYEKTTPQHTFQPFLCAPRMRILTTLAVVFNSVRIGYNRLPQVGIVIIKYTDIAYFEIFSNVSSYVRLSAAYECNKEYNEFYLILIESRVSINSLYIRSF